MDAVCCGDVFAMVNHVQHLQRIHFPIALLADQVDALATAVSEHAGDQLPDCVQIQVRYLHALCLALAHDYEELQRVDALVVHHQRHALKAFEMAYHAKLEELLAVDPHPLCKYVSEGAPELWFQLNLRIAKIHTGLLRLRLFGVPETGRDEGQDTRMIHPSSKGKLAQTLSASYLRSDREIFDAYAKIDFRPHKRLISSESTAVVPPLVMFRIPTPVECERSVCEMTKLYLVFRFEGEEPCHVDTHGGSEMTSGNIDSHPDLHSINSSQENNLSQRMHHPPLLHYATLVPDDHKSMKEVLQLAHRAGGPPEYRWLCTPSAEANTTALESSSLSLASSSTARVTASASRVAHNLFSTDVDLPLEALSRDEETLSGSISTHTSNERIQPRFTIFAAPPVSLLMTQTPCTCRREWDQKVGKLPTPPTYIIVRVCKIAALPSGLLQRFIHSPSDVLMNPRLSASATSLSGSVENIAVRNSGELRFQVYGEVEWYSNEERTHFLPFT